MKTFKTESGLELPLDNIKNNDYLKAQWRVYWMRKEKPDWTIETEILRADDKEALAKAIIKDAQGRIIATAHKTETQKDFPAGWVEKAETAAVGRALAFCGYGTQFAIDLDEADRIVDSPIQRVAPKPPLSTNVTVMNRPQELMALLKVKNITKEYVTSEMQRHFDKSLSSELTEMEYQKLKSMLEGLPNANVS